MDAETFRKEGYRVIDDIVDYYENIRKRKVVADVEPGFLFERMEKEPPVEGVRFEQVRSDLWENIMSGVTHWQHPQFFGFYPAQTSFPAMLADMYSGMIGSIGFNWKSNPVGTELELVMMDWLVRMLDLPHFYLHKSKGGGVIQSTASESSLLAILAAREKAKQNGMNGHFVVYCSDQTHSCTEKACKILGLECCVLPTTDFILTADVFQKAIEEHLQQGKTPICITATIGTTGVCAVDDVEEIGIVCQKYGIWLNVDAAYAGSAAICPEFRYLFRGLEYSDSFCFNPHKWLLVNFDCTAFFVKEKKYLIDSMSIMPPYLVHAYDDNVTDFRHWQIPLGRRFRALKLWFVIKTYGVRGLQEHIRKDVGLARYFRERLEKLNEIEIIRAELGLVCFRARGQSEENQLILLEAINRCGVFLVNTCDPAGRVIIRLSISSKLTTQQDIEHVVRLISDTLKLLQ